MKVFVAGATRTVGRPLVARLLEAGHDLVGTTRREDRAADLRAQGVEPVVVNAFDADALATAARRARPEVVFQQLTALPQAGTAGARDHAATSRLRVERTRDLLRGRTGVPSRRAKLVLGPSTHRTFGPGTAAGAGSLR